MKRQLSQAQEAAVEERGWMMGRYWCQKCPSKRDDDLQILYIYMGMDQYLLIPFLGGWTSIYQLFWCSPGVQGFDTLPYIYIFIYYIIYIYILLYPDDTQFVTIRIHLVRWCSHRNLHLWAISISHCHIWLPESVYLHWEGWNYRSSQATRGSPGRWLPAANKSGQLSSLIFHGEKW